jgi:nucleoside 2-deoxyribosyltransferase
MMKIYVAAMYAQKHYVTDVVTYLREHGFEVTSTWHTEPHDPNVQLHEVTGSEREELARRDIDEIDAADTLLLLTQKPTTATVRGGRHVEFGYALGKGKNLICVGPKENIFHSLYNILVVSTVEEAVAMLMTYKKPEELRVIDPKTGGQKGIKPARMDLIPPEPIWQLSLVYGMGANKYDDDNWRLGYSWRLSIGALLRHTFLFIKGEYLDSESHLPHLAHVMWHCCTLMEFMRLNLGTDDRYSTKDKQTQ